MIVVDVFMRITPFGGKPFLLQTRAWDVVRFRASVCKAHAEAREGPGVVEFLTEQQFKEEEKRWKRNQAGH